MNARSFVKRVARRCGFDIIRYHPRSSAAARRARLFQHHAINLVLDVGASSGGFALELRSTGYTGRIVSFEPLSAPFARLEARARPDPEWHAIHVGLGRIPEQRRINIARNSESSSLLDIEPRHKAAYPDAAYVGSEEVSIVRLDDVFDRCYQARDRVCLKIDAQGYERHVLDGGASSLPAIQGVQLELSLVPMYTGEPRLVEMITYLQARGFVLMSFQPVVEDPKSGQLLQVDGLFFRDPGVQ